MQTPSLTTPFGRRPASLGQVAAQIAVRDALRDAAAPGSNAPAAVNKWQLFRTLTEIRGRLGLSDRSLSLLNALLSFHPETALVLPRPDDGEGEGAYGPCSLVVFPSNRQLSLRAHGMAEKTIRNHLAALVAAGLIARRDSPNGKRYARRGGGEDDRPSDAFGFDLTPLVARAVAFEAMADAERRDRQRLHLLKERISLFRRDAAKLIALGLEQDASGPWEALRQRYMALLTPVRRLRDACELTALEAALCALRNDAASALEVLVNAAEDTGNDGSFDRHLSNSKTEASIESEPAAEDAGGWIDSGPEANVVLETKAAAGGDRTGGAEPEPLPLGLVLEACPDVADYADGGEVKSWRAFREAAATIRPMIGISPDAWQSARAALGEVGAHVAVAAILQRSIHSSEALVSRQEGGGERITVNGSPAIQSPGGYLRSLVDQAGRGKFSIGPMLMALIGQRLKVRRASAARGPR